MACAPVRLTFHEHFPLHRIPCAAIVRFPADMAMMLCRRPCTVDRESNYRILVRRTLQNKNENVNSSCTCTCERTQISNQHETHRQRITIAIWIRCRRRWQSIWWIRRICFRRSIFRILSIFCRCAPLWFHANRALLRSFDWFGRPSNCSPTTKSIGAFRVATSTFSARDVVVDSTWWWWCHAPACKPFAPFRPNSADLMCWNSCAAVVAAANVWHCRSDSSCSTWFSGCEKILLFLSFDDVSAEDAIDVRWLTSFSACKCTFLLRHRFTAPHFFVDWCRRTAECR